MATVGVTIAGRTYRMACGEGEEGHLQALAKHVDTKLAELRKGFGEIGDTRLVIMTAITVADELFEEDALVWDPVRSRRLAYGAADGPRLEVAWDAPRLGVWTRPGARFVCVEPWHGHADPQGFAGEFRDKPGVFHVPAGGEWRTAMSVTLAV